MSLMGGKNYWFLNLIVDRSMQVGGNARLHILGLIWGNILCLLIVNVPRMSSCGHARVKILLLNWWLALVKLLKKCKFIQFVAIFWLLKLGRPLTYFENMKEPFNILKVKNTSHKHWFNSTS